MKFSKVSIIGCGLIGKSFAMLFVSGGYEVHIYDTCKKQAFGALHDIETEINKLKADGMLRGTLTAEQQIACIKVSNSLEECLSNSMHVQECVPENIELKIKIFKELDKIAGPNTVLSSSTSCIMPSKFTEDLMNRSNCLVSHPVNPPYYVPAVEVIPAPWTSRDVMTRTCELLSKIGLNPVKFNKEIEGFGLNRIQYALLNECWNLVKNGILSVQDVDTLVKDGLARRYVWCGPFETIHLNAEGTESYIELYGKTIKKVSETFDETPSWKSVDAKDIIEQMNHVIPIEEIQARRKWRDQRLAELSNLKKIMKEKED